MVKGPKLAKTDQNAASQQLNIRQSMTKPTEGKLGKVAQFLTSSGVGKMYEDVLEELVCNKTCN